MARGYRAVFVGTILLLGIVGVGEHAYADDCPAVGAWRVDDAADAADSVPGDGLCATAAGKCSFRAALEEINACGGSANSLTFNLPLPATLTIQSGALRIQENVSVLGPDSASLTIDLSGTEDQFLVVDSPGGGKTVLLHGLTLSGAKRASGAALVVGDGETVALDSVRITANNSLIAGGVLNLGALAVTGSQITANAGQWGGGIYSDGSLTMTGSLVAKNAAEAGGGLFITGGTAALKNVTFEGNSASERGNDIYALDPSSVTRTETAAEIASGTGIVGRSGAAVREWDLMWSLQQPQGNGCEFAAAGAGLGAGGLLLPLAGLFLFFLERRRRRI